MQVLIQVRDVDDDVRAALKARAAAAGVSLNSYLRDLLTQAAQTPTRADVLARIALRTERTTMSAVDLVRAERDARSARR